jgi:hypothetical protein
MYDAVNNWHLLSIYYDSDGPTDVMAAMSDGGIGVMARWILESREENRWRVEAVNTEGGIWGPVEVFDEGECVPPTPPVMKVL